MVVIFADDVFNVFSFKEEMFQFGLKFHTAHCLGVGHRTGDKAWNHFVPRTNEHQDLWRHNGLMALPVGITTDEGTTIEVDHDLSLAKKILARQPIVKFFYN